MILLQLESGNKSLRLADNIDLVTGHKDKLTDLASRLTNLDHAGNAGNDREHGDNPGKENTVGHTRDNREGRRWMRCTTSNIILAATSSLELTDCVLSM